MELPVPRYDRFNNRRERPEPDQGPTGAKDDDPDGVEYSPEKISNMKQRLYLCNQVPTTFIEEEKIGVPYPVPRYPLQRTSALSDYNKFTIFIPNPAQGQHR